MPSLTISKTYEDGDVLLESDLDLIRTDITTFINTTKLDADNLQDAAVTTAKLASDAVTTAKITDANVTTAKIADNAITGAKLDAKIGSLVGEVKLFHTFNGTLSVPRGWMVLDGDVVNQTNYDSLHGAGAYSTDGVSSSALLNKNLPNMASRYPRGATTTTQDGSSAITTVGNANSTINIQHSHTVDSHNHKWYDQVDSSESRVYDSSGTSVRMDSHRSNVSYNLNEERIEFDDWTSPDIGTRDVMRDMYTDNQSPGTNNQLSTSQNIEPESIEFIYIMKVI